MAEVRSSTPAPLLVRVGDLSLSLSPGVGTTQPETGVHNVSKSVSSN